MPDLAELVREELRSMAAAVEAPADLDQRARGRVRRHMRRRRLAVGGAAAVVVVGLAAAGALAVPEDGPSVVAGPTDQTTRSPLYLVPGWVPEGLELDEAGGDAATEQPPADTSERGSESYLRFDAAHEHAEAKMTLQWGIDLGNIVDPAALGAEAVDDPLVALAGIGEPVDIGGQPGYHLLGEVVWAAPDGSLRALSGQYFENMPDPGPMDRDTLVAAAASVAEGGPDGPVITEIPPGFEPTGPLPIEPSLGTETQRLSYTAADGREVQVTVADGSQVSPLATIAGAASRVIDVRGHEAVLDHPTLPATPDGDVPAPVLALAWDERPETQVRITGAGVDEADLRRIADELVEVSPEEWEALVDSMSTTDTATATTDLTTTDEAAGGSTTATTPSTGGDDDLSGDADASGAELSLTGTYDGTEHYTLGTEECPDLDHEYDASVTWADGSTWALYEDYCGRIVDDVWSGEGTFTLTGPDGDALRGTFTSEASSSGDGEPYTLIITGGSGRFVGGSGECTADNHVERMVLGTQEQTGAITCAVQLPTG